MLPENCHLVEKIGENHSLATFFLGNVELSISTWPFGSTNTPIGHQRDEAPVENQKWSIFYKISHLMVGYAFLFCC